MQMHDYESIYIQTVSMCACLCTITKIPCRHIQDHHVVVSVLAIIYTRTPLMFAIDVWMSTIELTCFPIVMHHLLS